MQRRIGPLVLAALLGLGACASTPDDAAEESPEPSSAISGRRFAPEPPQRPKAGAYVYELYGIGETEGRIPADTELTEQVTVSGDVYTVDITNNRTTNTRQIQQRWETNRLVLLSSTTTIRGSRNSCRYEPPLEILHIPIQQEEFREQQSSGCSETTLITVTGKETIDDAAGKSWDTWVIQAQTLGNGRTDEETRWFSPELGRYVRLDTSTETSEGRTQTSQLLRDYPG